MKKTKILFAIWAIIVLIIIGLLTALGFILKNRYEKYHDLEEKLIQVANEYAYDHLFLEEGEQKYVDAQELVDAKYLDTLEVDDDVCTGYVVIDRENVYLIEAYISCDDYTTDSYQIIK